MTIDVFSAFIIGILGAGHCIAMCGGVSTMFTSAIANQSSKNTLVIGYNLGRILSYTVAGAIAGLTSSLAAKSLGIPISFLRVVSAVFLVLLGLYIGQWLFILRHVERLGQGLWQKISPLSKKLLPVNSFKNALFIGALWGWLPCGLVYSTLTWSLSSGSLFNGALIMLFFGLGTLPAMITTAFSMNLVKDFLSNLIFRKIIAISLIIYGLYTIQLIYFGMK